MGADFIYGALVIPAKYETTDEFFSYLEAELAGMDDANIAEATPNATDCLEDGDVRGYVADALAELKAWTGMRDIDLCVLQDGGATIRFLLTGGMSWGDSPTEACNAVWCVQELINYLDGPA